MFLGEQVLETGIFFPAGETKSAFVLRSDLAEATANVLTSEGHENKEYAMNNVENYSFQEVADVLGKIANKKIDYINPDADVYTDALSTAGVPAEYIGMFAGFAEAIKQGEFNSSKTDLENLLGRKPTSLEDFLKQVYASN
ncbi:Quinone oxidoreductase 2 [compost metagenome]